MLEVSEGVQCTPCTMIERGNFEPLSPKKNLILKTLKGLKEFEFNVEIAFYVHGETMRCSHTRTLPIYWS
jgi:hypothetical protein